LIGRRSTAAHALHQGVATALGRQENPMATIRLWPDMTTWISVRVAIVGAVVVAACLWYAAISTVL
jgi:hypothetical protein